MDADAATARAKAEARRAKILARQKDRLSSITGAYARPEGPSDASGTPSAPAAATAQPSAPESVGSEPATQQQQQLAHQQQDAAAVAQEQQMQALMATLERQLQHAQALQASAQPLLAQQQTHRATEPTAPAAAVDALQSLLGRSAAAGAGAGAPSDADGQEQQQQQQQQPPLLLQLGPVLSRSVKQTQLFRLLAAMLLAYAALTGWLGQLGLPPVAVLLLTDLAVVLAGAAVLPAPKPTEAAAAAGAGVQVPWRLRSLDVISLVPGLRGLLDSLAGYNAVATAVSQDFAAYLVVCGLLLTTHAVPAAVSWGLRL